MVALRSRREDRALLVAAWVLALAVLGVGIAAGAPILILWGVLGVAASVFATRIHLRDTGARRSRDAADSVDTDSVDTDSVDTDAVKTEAVDEEQVR